MLNGLLNLIYPSFCTICEKKIDQKNFPVCQNCLGKIKPIPKVICQVCGQPRFDSICPQCKERSPFFTQARATGVYEGVLKKCIQIFKYQKKTSLQRPLANLLLKFLENNPNWSEIDYFVPVPLTKMRLRERGFNQADLLARCLSKSLNIKISSNNLKRKDSFLSQIKSTRAERNKNVTGAFYVKRPEIFQDKKILLIDDVLTTTSTANACAQVLKESGSKEILVLTLARTC